VAAFNWVEFESQCPVCSQNTKIRVQCHIAASFEGDDRGRFCRKNYRVGEKLHWWHSNHENYRKWGIGGQSTGGNPRSVLECCYASCVASGDKLYVVLEITDLEIRKVHEIGPDQDWPVAYPK
jgi:hypothetical protein